MCAPPDFQNEESPDELQLIEASGIEALPKKISRYGLAKKRALEVLEYIDATPFWGSKTKLTNIGRAARRLRTCGDYLAFAHYMAIDEVRLVGAQLCSKHLLCPLCAIRRGAKALQAYLPRFEEITRLRPDLRPFLVTLTVKDGPDLHERFVHLQQSQHELWKRKRRGRGSVLDPVAAAVWSYEIKRGANSGLWHPHLHMVAMASVPPCAALLAAEWKDITGDSFIVDVRPISQDDPVSGFLEVFKYALKFSDMTPADTVHAFNWLSGRRLVGSAGLFRGIEVPESGLDEELADMPYAELFFRYVRGQYRLQTHIQRTPGPRVGAAERPSV